jgi:DNA modification methylase
LSDTPNTLYYGDNLDVLRRHVPDESVDLVYLDPPFNSNANYNIFFAAKDGQSAYFGLTGVYTRRGFSASVSLFRDVSRKGTLDDDWMDPQKVA